MATRKHHSIGEVLALLQDDFPDITISKIRFLESQGLISPERTPSGYRRFFQHDLERLRWILTQQRDHYLPLKVIREKLAAGEPSADPEAATPATGADEADPNATEAPAADAGAADPGAPAADVDDDRAGAADAAPDARTLEGDASGAVTVGGTEPAPVGTEQAVPADHVSVPDEPGSVAGKAAPTQIELLEASEAVGASEPGEPAGAGALATDTGTEAPSAPVEPTADLGAGAAGEAGAEAEPEPAPGAAAPTPGNEEGCEASVDTDTDTDTDVEAGAGSDEAVEIGSSLDDARQASDADADAVPVGETDADPAVADLGHPRPDHDGSAEADAPPLSGQDDRGSAALLDEVASTGSVEAAGSAEAADVDRPPFAAASAPSRGRSRSRRAKGSKSLNGEAAGPIPEGGEPSDSSDRAETEEPSPADDGPAATGTGPASEAAPTPTPPAPEPVVALTRDELAEASGCPVPVLHDLERFGLLHGKTVGRGVLYDAEALVIAQLAARFANHGLEPRHLRSFRLAAERELGLFAQVVGPLLQRRDAMAHERAMETLTELTDLAAELHQVLVQNLLAREYGGR